MSVYRMQMKHGALDFKGVCVNVTMFTFHSNLTGSDSHLNKFTKLLWQKRHLLFPDTQTGKVYSDVKPRTRFNEDI